MEQTQLQINQIVLLTIKRLGINGEGIGYYKRKAVFVSDAIPGEVVEVKITDVRDTYAYAEIAKIKTKSEHRVQPDCPYYAKCGGCSMQHMDYKAQLALKEQLIGDAFERYYEGDLKRVEFRPILGMDNPWGYRNKAQLPVRHNGERVVVGMYARGSNMLVYTDKCIIETPLVSNTIHSILDLLTESNIDIYNPKFKQGSLRYLIVRGFEETQEVQVTFVLFKEDYHVLNALKRVLLVEHVKSISYSINSDPKSIEIVSDTILHVGGTKEIHGKLGKLDFKISPEAFFQLNTKQSIVLYDAVKKAIHFTGKEKVLDCYCGIGSIGLYVSDQAKEVRGIDNNISAIENAKIFAQENNIENAKFYYGNILPHLHNFEKEGFIPDVLIIDPPRKGMDINLINYLQTSKIKKIVYVSCNPSTLAKNVNHLQKQYVVRNIQPIDMFPQTANVEAVCLLERR